jgi:hypothetical protein
MTEERNAVLDVDDGAFGSLVDALRRPHDDGVGDGGNGNHGGNGGGGNGPGGGGDDGRPDFGPLLKTMREGFDRLADKQTAFADQLVAAAFDPLAKLVAALAGRVCVLEAEVAALRGSQKAGAKMGTPDGAN